MVPSDRQWFTKLLIGMLWGLLGGALYAVLFFVIGATIESGAGAIGEALFVGLLVATVVGVPLGAALGFVSALLLLLLLEHRRPPSARTRMLMGMGVCGALALAAMLLFLWSIWDGPGENLAQPALRTLVVVGIPSLAYMLMGGFAAVRYFAPRAALAEAGGGDLPGVAAQL
jgi:Na+-translocating ferredoxin:NAD+ oxidoreductase RnfD subunit